MMLAPLRERVERIGAQVLLTWPLPLQGFRYTFDVVASADPNARTSATGRVVVTTALLETLESDDQLAAVLAHEIAHVENRHAFQLSRVAHRAGLLWNLASPDGAVGGGFDAVRAEAAIPPIRAYLATFSRQLEDDADLFASIFLECSGRSGDLLADALEKLSRARLQTDLAYGPFSTHPVLSSRMQRQQVMTTADRVPLQQAFDAFGKDDVHLATLQLHFQQLRGEWLEIVASLIAAPAFPPDGAFQGIEVHLNTERLMFQSLRLEVASGVQLNVVFRLRRSTLLAGGVTGIVLHVGRVGRWTTRNGSDPGGSALGNAANCAGRSIEPSIVRH